MYTHTHTRIRNYVMVGADLPPPGLIGVMAGGEEGEEEEGEEKQE